LCGQNILYWKKCRIVDQAAAADAEAAVAEDVRTGVAAVTDVEAAVVTDAAVARDADVPVQVADAQVEVIVVVPAGRAAGAVRAVARPIPMVTALETTSRRFCCIVDSIL
jgi:hypothetical protein